MSLVAIGVVSHVGAVLVSTARVDGYVAASHPLAVLGAGGVVGAGWFNLLAFVLPGLCAAALAWRQRDASGVAAPWWLRIGLHMLLLSGLAFAAQGLWTLDLEELDGGRSRGHATAWMLWLVASVAGGAATSLGLAMRRDVVAALTCAASALLVLAAGNGWLPIDAGHTQRAGLIGWAVLLVTLALGRASRTG